jgi:sporulation protein YlmC with PRC-barrel domain
MYSGYTQRQPQQWAVSPAPNQTTVTDVIGADVKNAAGTTIAKIVDILIDPYNATAGVAILTSAGAQPFDHGKDSAVAWSSLSFDPRPTPHFTTRLNEAALDAGTSLVGKAKASASYLDVKKGLLGKEVIGPDGAAIGHVQNLVLTFGSGRVVALVIDTGGFITIGGANNHAVAWNAARPRAGANGGPVHIALTKAEVEGAPVTATMAPAPIGPQPGTQNAQVKHDATGNISGTKIAAPQNGR